MGALGGCAPPGGCDLAALRAALRSAGVTALVIPSEDPHQSEYSCGAHARREYVTGFTGTAGVAAVTLDKAALSTDGRYFLQASMQLDTSQWQLLRFGEPNVPTIGEWLCEQLSPGDRVGIDPELHSAESAENLRKELEAAGIELALLDSNPVDEVWGAKRPPMPDAQLRVHAERFAGLGVAQKLDKVRSEMAKEKAEVLLLSTLDEVAWIFNLRGDDVPHNPVAYAYGLIGKGFARLFVDAGKVTEEVSAHLAAAGVEVHPYGECAAQLKMCVGEGQRPWVDAATGSAGMMAAAEQGAKQQSAEQEVTEGRAAGADASGGGGACGTEGEPRAKKPRRAVGSAVLTKRSPVITLKSHKNDVELAGMRACHLRDGAALCRFFAWLEGAVARGEELDECSVSDRLEQERQALDGFITTSFDTIAGDGPNGAIVHYRARKATCRKLKAGDVFLLDSGGQYEDGTTDVTRTVFLGDGEPSDHVRRCFTLVLKGHIALDTLVFPEGTPGFAIDAFARHALWRAGLNYLHGTGHGVGAALNVHEGPQSISPRWNNKSGIEAGMICSNEPGYYEEGAFGIRIENLVSVQVAKTPCQFGGKPYLCFEKLTFVPLQAKLIDVTLLTKDEADWVDAYQARVKAKLEPLLGGGVGGDSAAKAWLVASTAPLDRSPGVGSRSATAGGPAPPKADAADDS